MASISLFLPIALAHDPTSGGDAWQTGDLMQGNTNASDQGNVWIRRDGNTINVHWHLSNSDNSSVNDQYVCLGSYPHVPPTDRCKGNDKDFTGPTGSQSSSDSWSFSYSGSETTFHIHVSTAETYTGNVSGVTTQKSNADPFETQSSEQGIIQPGTAVTDTATATGANGDPTGDITFYLCGPAALPNGCTTGGSLIGTKTLGGGTSSSSSATSDPASPTTPGRYCWRAEYSGDSNYNSDSHTNNTTECFDVASSGTTTTAVLGTQVTAESNADPAVVAGELPKTGPVPTLPALILALDLIGAGWIMRKLALLEELEKVGR